ncbi:MAG: hypothetical protein IPL05_20845 [Betaproteobacteria bacterium]|nr:hypothetical protein [Betaproteobacteria bacterium]
MLAFAAAGLARRRDRRNHHRRHAARPQPYRKIPGTILGIAAGLSTYFGLASQDPSLLQMSNNR